MGLITGAAVMLAVVLFLIVARPIRHGIFAAVPIDFRSALGMRLRGTPPTLIVDAMVALRMRGVESSMAMVEAAYLANRRASMTAAELADLVVAGSANSSQHTASSAS